MTLPQKFEVEMLSGLFGLNHLRGIGNNVCMSVCMYRCVNVCIWMPLTTPPVSKFLGRNSVNLSKNSVILEKALLSLSKISQIITKTICRGNSKFCANITLNKSTSLFQRFTFTIPSKFT